ncbi:ROK family transcriptional regulator [Desulfitobacterium chlororespirans]|uniref:Sugar kinase of the NBD/HSP70 family, may contain an N-terminal HTH domain n=1 Tax=Desulfitobacterium chlororespirans DSM 11544 TaxID=1121395 RepID=A0A1M7UDX9_9FIRM|nr:ROK family transcriptional regulator [Desulfitobacterium chlororespirans]SHN81135.1 Sugar kinase of the NBD/HSP70 family, may contain an N-terminal HTH domain [Desulfitobacterium chlororespirans DSM 11544]
MRTGVLIYKDVLSSLSPEAKKILGLILHKGAMTKSQLAKVAGLKPTTLNRMMLPLEKADLILPTETGESTGGRKPVIYDVNPRRYYVIGIDISRLYSQVVLTNLKMELIEKDRFDMDRNSSPQATLNRILDWIGRVMEKRGHGYVIGVGIGTVGPLDRQSGIILNPENFEAQGWENIPLKAIVEERTGLPVIIDNGANGAVLAETRYGSGKGMKSVIYLNCGVGIRTGVISSGTLVRTINDADDTFAHMVIDVNGKPCHCGNQGCVERYSSIYAIMEALAEEMTPEEMPQGKDRRNHKADRPVSYLELCREAEENDTTARQVLQNAAVRMGTGLANFIQLLNPGLVVLSGPLILHSQLFYEVCVEAAKRRRPWDKGGHLVFSRGGAFEENAISIGAGALVVEHYLEPETFG